MVHHVERILDLEAGIVEDWFCHYCVDPRAPQSQFSNLDHWICCTPRKDLTIRWSERRPALCPRAGRVQSLSVIDVRPRSPSLTFVSLDLMKASSQGNILVLLGIGCLFAGFFRKPLGLPDWTAYLFPVLGGLLALTGVWVRRRPYKGAAPPVVAITPQQYKKRLWTLLLIIVVTSLTSPFYLRYSDTGLTFPALVACSVVSCVVCVTLVTLSMRRHRPKV